MRREATARSLHTNGSDLLQHRLPVLDHASTKLAVSTLNRSSVLPEPSLKTLLTLGSLTSAHTKSRMPRTESPKIPGRLL